MSSSAPPLSKKQQKTLAFRAKQKSKPAPAIPDDVPETDLLDDEDEIIEPLAEGSNPASLDGKKRKRDLDDVDVAGGNETGVKGKGKGKEKTAWDEDEGEGKEEVSKKKSKKEIKQRFILFVGNLGYKTTREDIANHFKEAISHLPSVRLLTEKPNPRSPAGMAPKSRGIAFIEVLSSAEMQSALKLHHSELQGRVINVELTAGGGGKTAGRMEKIKERNERVEGQREKRAEKEGEGDGGDGDEDRIVVDGMEDVGGAESQSGKTKIRGGRRVKNKPKTDSESKSEALKGAAAGWATRTTPVKGSTRGGRGGSRPSSSSSSSSRGAIRGGPGGRGMGGKKWEPTGANALVVG